MRSKVIKNLTIQKKVFHLRDKSNSKTDKKTCKFIILKKL